MSDYISRDEIFSVWRSMPKPASISSLTDAINRTPAADVEPVRHGRWISWEDADNCIPSPNRHECSVCHDAAQVLVNKIELLSNYCPNCGAKMDLEGENNENFSK